ncbi:MAG: S9 family peptidase [Acidobacteriota bacterium]|nr:S9 family peptidase [Acidobacteriota bacterium]
MRRLLTFALMVVLGAALPRAGGAQTRHPVTLDDIMGMRTLAGTPAIAPDGHAVLYAVREWEKVPEPEGGQKMEARTHVWIAAADGSGARQFTFSDSSEMDPSWSPDGRMVAFLSPRASAGGAGAQPARPQVWVMEANGGEAWRLTHAEDGVQDYAWSPDSRRIAFTSRQARPKAEQTARKEGNDPEVFEGDFQRTRLWIVDVSSSGKAPAATELTGPDDFTVKGSITWAPDGTRVAFAASPTPMTRDDRTDVYIVDIAAKTAMKITTNLGPDVAPAWSPDGKTIAYLETPNSAAPNGDGIPPQSLSNAHLMLYDVATKQARDVSAGFDASPDGPVWTADSQRILFDAGRRVYQEMYAYDVGAGRYRQLTTDKVIRFGTVSREGDRAAFVMQSSTAPADVYAADLTFSSPVKLTTVNPQAAAFDLGATKAITWKSPDGRTIEGVLQEPVGYQPGHRYPLLVVAHGGPTGAYEDTYRVGEFDGGQLWAGEGWAVLYPNPRGSTNYGQAFMRANIGDWGGGDYQDIMSGVDALVSRGIADPDRMAFMGWSYGGYMTCWTVSQTGRFKAAMMGAGLSDLVSMYGTTDIPNYLETFFHGTPDGTRIPLYRARSGLTFVDRVTTPLLILQGGSDVRVPTSQSMEFFRALKDRGKTVELVYYPREGHGFVEYYHLRDRIERLHAWIVRYTLGSGKKTSAP